MKLRQVPPARFPARHEKLLESAKPVLHTGLHVAPDGRLLLQSPMFTFVGAVTVHGLGLHVAAVKVPAEQLDVPDTV
jgi:hypothetical protein